MARTDVIKSVHKQVSSSTSLTFSYLTFFIFLAEVTYNIML